MLIAASDQLQYVVALGSVRHHCSYAKSTNWARDIARDMRKPTLRRAHEEPKDLRRKKGTVQRSLRINENRINKRNFFCLKEAFRS